MAFGAGLSHRYPDDVRDGIATKARYEGGALYVDLDPSTIPVASSVPTGAVLLAYDPTQHTLVLLPPSLIGTGSGGGTQVPFDTAFKAWFAALPTSVPTTVSTPWNDGGLLAVTPAS